MKDGQLGGIQIEGRQAVRELLRANRRRVREVFVASDRKESPVLDEIVSLANKQHARLRPIPVDQLVDRAATDAHQGVIAFADPIEPAELDALFKTPNTFVVALDGVTDPQNMGAIMRSALGAGATGMILPKHRAAHFSPAAMKSAAGAAEYLPCAVVSGIPAVLERAKRAQLWTVGLDSDGSTVMSELTLADQPLVLVLGAEGRGLGRLTRERCDVVAGIPMHGPLDSLNVAAAAAVACFEIARRRTEKTMNP